ncbi:hypothetical protein Acsp04_25780 [Actinomadura sp. NBRC 104425]|uniref:hypothetical protein n=1 Tax=Actinomadura sp. NBRC 104425 TaxID=3032204 RepID=UPI0024A06627|nr:hypothetical protein [Actinomadura sp. NBRC 104425]GLZ12343.1 hypothetical protein Acsp04_25780 [Actinomadura sp. NBRC 104425]
MDRRAEHLAVMAVVTAAAVVPAAIAAVVKAGPEESRGTPRTPVAAVQSAPAPETAGASRSPLPENTPEAAPTGGAPTTASVAPGRTSHAAAADTPAPRASDTRTTLRSYVRVTEVRLSGAANGDYEHATETARFTLAPRFALDATGVRTSVRGGEKTTVTQRAVVKGRTVSGYDGTAWQHRTLTDAQLAGLRQGSDPRRLADLVRSLPGVNRSAPDRSGSVRYTAGVSIGDLLALLPEAETGPAGRALRSVPSGIGVSLDMRVDAEGRPTWIGLNAAVPGGRFSGSMAFRSYR